MPQFLSWLASLIGLYWLIFALPIASHLQRPAPHVRYPYESPETSSAQLKAFEEVLELSHGGTRPVNVSLLQPIFALRHDSQRDEPDIIKLIDTVRQSLLQQGDTPAFKDSREVSATDSDELIPLNHMAPLEAVHEEFNPLKYWYKAWEDMCLFQDSRFHMTTNESRSLHPNYRMATFQTNTGWLLSILISKKYAFKSKQYPDERAWTWSPFAYPFGPLKITFELLANRQNFALTQDEFLVIMESTPESCEVSFTTLVEYRDKGHDITVEFTFYPMSLSARFLPWTVASSFVMPEPFPLIDAEECTEFSTATTFASGRQWRKDYDRLRTMVAEMRSRHNIGSFEYWPFFDAYNHVYAWGPGEGTRDKTLMFRKYSVKQSIDINTKGKPAHRQTVFPYSVVTTSKASEETETLTSSPIPLEKLTFPSPAPTKKLATDEGNELNEL